MLSPDEVRAVRESAEEIHAPQAVEAALDRMAAEIAVLAGEENPLVLCVMIGGLTPTARLIERFRFAHQLDYIHATRYRGDTRGGHAEWRATPRLSLADRTVLIVDDILDEGITLAHIRDYCIDQGARRVLCTVLVRKRHERKVAGIEADVVGLDVPDRYVFGCGMDYKEHLRHLPGIYARGES